MTLFTSTLPKPLQVKKHHDDARVFTLGRYPNWSLTAEHPTTQKHFLKVAPYSFSSVSTDKYT